MARQDKCERTNKYNSSTSRSEKENDLRDEHWR